MHKIIYLFFLFIFSVPALQASDLVREARLKNEIIDGILDGNPYMLTADGHQFLSIYTEAENPRGAVLILHGRGFHPDWADVVNPLRVGLVEHGWNTLSIQLPVLEKTAKFYDYVQIFDEAIPRIEAAIDFLQQQGNDKIILIAHSCGSHMAMHYIRNKGAARFDAYVGIGMGATDFEQPMLEPMPLDSVKKPIFDIYGEDDYPAVQSMAESRARQMLIDGHPLSRQKAIARANHFFTNMGAPLLQSVAEWLETLK